MLEIEITYTSPDIPEIVEEQEPVVQEVEEEII